MDDYSDIRASLESITPIPEEEWEWTCRNTRQHFVAKGEFLIREGDSVNKLFFVRSGVFRVFYMTGSEEVNRSFVLPGRFYTNSLALNLELPSHYWVEALEDAELPYIERDHVLEGYERHRCWERVSRVLALRRLHLKELQEQRFRSMSTEEHYYWMVENEPELIARIPLYHLASYLQIRPETLSRIRARGRA